jgi:hypothetical protein
MEHDIFHRGNGKWLFVALIFLFVIATATTTARPVNNSTAIIGETLLTFQNDSGNLSGSCTLSNVDLGGSIVIPFGCPNFDSSGMGLVAGPYKYWSDTGTSCINTSKCDVTFLDPSLVVKTTSSNPKYPEYEVTAVAKNRDVYLNATTNLGIIGGNCGITFTLTDQLGNTIAVDGLGNPLNDRPLGAAGSASMLMNTTDYTVGNYNLSVKANSSCNGLVAESTPVTIEVLEAGITLSVDKTTVSIREGVSFAGTAQPLETVWIKVSKGNAVQVDFQNGTGEFEAGSNSLQYDDVNGSRAIKMDATRDGRYGVVVKINQSGMYKFDAGISGFNATVSVSVSEVGATVATNKSVYVIGEFANVTGTATAGENVVIAIDDEVRSNNTVIDVNGLLNSYLILLIIPQAHVPLISGYAQLR